MKKSGGDNSNFILTLSIVSGSVSQGATVQRGRSCRLMGQSVLQEKTVPAWTLALDTVWSRERPLKPRMDVTTGQNSHTHGKNTLHAYTTHLSFGKKEQETKYVGFPLCFSTCEGGRFNCSRYPCPGGWNQLRIIKAQHMKLFFIVCAVFFTCTKNVCSLFRLTITRRYCIVKWCLGSAINVDVTSLCVFPVSGGWCEWSEWTPCSRTCGAESVTRYRSCGCPEPKAGGAACSGDQEMHNGVGVQIQRQPCPVITFCPGK